MSYESEARCVRCKGSVVAEIETTKTGPQITSFHCSNPWCQLMYYRPPGRPNAVREIMEEINAHKQQKEEIKMSFKQLQVLIATKLDTFDRWLCVELPSPLRVWWHRLWLRKDESHPSLNHDVRYMLKHPDKIKSYKENLWKRRDTVHERSLEG